MKRTLYIDGDRTIFIVKKPTSIELNELQKLADDIVNVSDLGMIPYKSEEPEPEGNKIIEKLKNGLSDNLKQFEEINNSLLVNELINWFFKNKSDIIKVYPEYDMSDINIELISLLVKKIRTSWTTHD